MEITKEIFLASRRKVDGIAAAAVSFPEPLAEDSEVDVSDIPSKMYLDEFGREIHVRGPLVAQVGKPESLREKIARFDRLAEQVARSRAIMMSTVDEFGPDVDEDPDDDSFLDDIDETDPFGDPIVAEPLPAKPAVAEPATKVSVAAADTKVDANGGDDAAGDSLPDPGQE